MTGYSTPQTSRTPKPDSAILPKANVKDSDPEISTNRIGDKQLKISIPKNAQISFAYEEINSQGNKCFGTMSAPQGDILSTRIAGIATVRKDAGELSISLENASSFSAIVSKENGEVIKINLSEILQAKNQSSEQIKDKSPKIAEPANASTESNKQLERASATKDRAEPTIPSPLADLGISLPKINFPQLQSKKEQNSAQSENDPRSQVDGLNSLAKQAEQLELPIELLNSVIKHNLTTNKNDQILDLSKIKSVKGEYQYCTEDSCIPLCSVQPQSSKAESGPARRAEPPKVNVVTKEAERSSATVPIANPRQQDIPDLQRLPALSQLPFAYEKNGTKISGVINIPSAQTLNMHYPGVGKFQRNNDGSFKFEAENGFNGTFSPQGSASSLGLSSQTSTTASIQTPSEFTRPSIKQREPIRDFLGNTLERGKNLLRLNSTQAQDYIQKNPDKNVVLIVTSPAICDPCKTYDSMLPNVTNRIGEKATFLIVDNGSYSNNTFNVTSIPQTLVFARGRIHSLSEEKRITGAPTSSERRIQEIEGALR